MSQTAVLSERFKAWREFIGFEYEEFIIDHSFQNSL
jgi:hypothetical protein